MTQPQRFPAAVVAALALATLAACGEPPRAAPVVRPVFVSVVQPTAGAQTRSFTATVRARVESELSFRAGGKVMERLVDVGDSVRPGQPLARLDAADYQLALQAAADQMRAAAVDAEQAASDEARFRRLAAEGSVGAADHERQKARADAAQARLDQARQQWQLARNREAYTTLLAPFAGVVTGLRLERGQVVGEGQPVLSMAREGEREIVADIPESWVGQVRAARARLVSAGAATTSPLALQLRELSPLATAQGRTFRARFTAAGPSRAALAALPLGSTAELQLALASPGEATVALPVSALVKGSGEPGVWLINPAGNGLVFQPVRLQSVDESTLRVSGLQAGQRVVSVGAQKLDAQLAVRPVERGESGSPSVTSRSGT